MSISHIMPSSTPSPVVAEQRLLTNHQLSRTTASYTILVGRREEASDGNPIPADISSNEAASGRSILLAKNTIGT